MTPTRRLEPRKAPTQDRAVETRDRILQAAAHVFARHGYAAGTTNRIAAEAGASVGSVYQYFPNKDAILVALVRRHVVSGSDLLAGALHASEGRPVVERLEVVVDAMLAEHVGDPRLHQVLFEEAPRPAELLEELHALERSYVDAVEEMITADPTVDVADPAMAARVVVTAIESLIHRNVAQRHVHLDLEGFRRELLTMLARYLTGTSR